MSVATDAELLQRHRLTVADYHRMAEVGVLAPDARVELIEGELIDVAPMRSRHAWLVRQLDRRLQRAVGERASVTCQTPLRLGDRSEPEPDLMLLRPRDDDYRRAHPEASDVLLLIEVAETTIEYDRRIKLPLYARHGVAEVWIVDLDGGLLRRHRHPSGGQYAEVTTNADPGCEAVAALPGLEVDLRGLLAPA